MMFNNKISESKNQLREKFFILRNEMADKNIEISSDLISNKIVSSSYFHNANNIAVYIPSKNEVNTCKVIEQAWDLNKTVLAPKTDSTLNKMYFYKINSWEELEMGKFRILEPIVGEKKPFPIEDIEVILIPGIVFDYYGYRIGYGKGYFDRFLKLSSSSLYKVGVCYNFQVVDKLPILEHDYAVDEIVTEEQNLFIKPYNNNEIID